MRKMTYIVAKELNQLKIYSSDNNIKLETTLDVGNDVTQIKDIYIDSLGYLYFYNKNSLKCKITGQELKIPEDFIFDGENVFFLNFDKRSYKKINLFTNKAIEIVLPFEIKNLKKSHCFFDEKLLIFGENSVFYENFEKRFDFKIKRVQNILSGFLILDIENKLHIVDPETLKIEKSFASSDEVVDIAANPESMNVILVAREYCMLLDLNSKKFLHKLSFNDKVGKVAFINQQKVLFESSKLFVYDFFGEKFDNVEFEDYKIFNSKEIEFQLDKKGKYSCRDCKSLKVEDLTNLIIEMKIEFKKELFLLGNEIEMLKEKLEISTNNK